MKSVKSSSSGDELLEALQVRKHRRRKARTSTISSRLNPDFDVKANIQNLPSKTTNQHDGKEHANKNPANNAAKLDITAMPIVDRQDISASFKISMLNITLKFMKDPTRLTLTYPEMSLTEAQFLYNLLDPAKAKEVNLGQGFKSLYASLYETMQKLKQNVEFEISFAGTVSLNTTRLVMKKIVKNPQVGAKKRADSDTSKNLNSSVSSAASSNAGHATKLTKAQREFLSKEKIVKKLPESFLKNTLEKYLGFIEDKQQGSLQFKDVNVAETRFLECLPCSSSVSLTSPRSAVLGELFGEQCEVLLKRIRRATRRDGCAVRVDVGKLSRPNATRWITFYKSPVYDLTTDNKPAEDNATKDLHKAEKFAKAFNIPLKSTENEKGNNKDKIVSNNVPKSKHIDSNVKDSKSDLKELRSVRIEGKELRVSLCGTNGDREANNKITDSQEKGDHNSNVACDGKQRRRQLAAISFQSAGSLAIAAPPPGGAGDGAGGGGAGPLPPPASRRGRLLKALATPIDGGLAEKMMRNMGWEGGALGARGEGIVEPIMPAIHLKPGAGFGHVKQSQPEISIVAFRCKLLETLLSLLRSSSNTIALSLPQPATKKCFRFFKPVLQSFNKRKKVDWSGPEMELVTEVSEEMLKDLHLQVTFSVSNDLKEFLLEKSFGPAVEVTTKKKNKSKSKSTKKKLASVDVITADETIKVIESLCPSKKAAEKLAYKIKFLEKIKEFLENENGVESYTFGCDMNKKKKLYLHRIMSDINKKTFTRRQSDLENALMRGIQGVAKDWFVSIEFSHQSFKLSKKPITVNKIKTPLKPTDLSKTIVYIDDKAISAEEYKEITAKNNKVDKNNDRNIDDVANDLKINPNGAGETKTIDQDKNTNTNEQLMDAKDSKSSPCVKKLISDHIKIQNDKNLETEPSKVNMPDLANDVYDCDKNESCDNNITASSDDNRLILPESDASDNDKLSDLDISKAEDVNERNENHGRIFIDEKVFFGEDDFDNNNKLSFPASDNSAANDTDKDVELDFGSNNTKNSVDINHNVMKDKREVIVDSLLNISDSDF